jgi:hypothetical protein
VESLKTFASLWKVVVCQIEWTNFLLCTCKARKINNSHCFWSNSPQKNSQKFTQIGDFCQIVESLKALSYLDLVLCSMNQPQMVFWLIKFRFFSRRVFLASDCISAEGSLIQGCQIFLGTKWENYTKLPRTMLKVHKI